MVSISPAASGIHPDDLKNLLDRDDILGLGESYWQSVFRHRTGYCLRLKPP